MNRSVSIWLKGLISALIIGVANSIASMIAAPAQFNFDHGLKKLLSVMVISGIIGAAAYLKESPLPGKGQEGEVGLTIGKTEK